MLKITLRSDNREVSFSHFPGCALCVSRRPPWLYVALEQIENIRCFNSAAARRQDSGQTGPRLHAPTMFMWTVRAKLIGSTRRSKAMISETERARHVAWLPIATSPWPDGEWAEVRSSQVESGEGCPGLLLAKQRPRGWLDGSNMAAASAETDRVRQQRRASVGFTVYWPGWEMGGLRSYLLFGSGAFHSGEEPGDNGFCTGCPTLLNISAGESWARIL